MNTYVCIFAILTIGYLVGRIEFKGLGLGSAAILIVSIVFGHYGVEIPAVVKNVGLVLFVASVGLSAGPVFINNFKKGAFSFITLGIVCICIGAGICVFCIKTMNIPVPLGLGIMAGALTSTPGLAAALEATGDSAASVGYGIAYVYGVVGVVLFVQILPRILKADPSSIAKIKEDTTITDKNYGTLEFGPSGFFPLALTCLTGALLGSLSFALPGGVEFSLGMAGGPLFTGLLIGALRHIGPISFKAPNSMLDTTRELGMVLFFTAAGTEAGAGFVSTIMEYGPVLLFAGFLITTFPMIISYLIAKYIFKIDLFISLGSVCGAMTSTPSLGALLSLTKSEVVAVAYAATYPIALIMVVLLVQAINIIL